MKAGDKIVEINGVRGGKVVGVVLIQVAKQVRTVPVNKCGDRLI